MQTTDKKFKVLALACLVQWVALAGVAAYAVQQSAPTRFKEIDVERLNLVDAKGTKRVVMANEEHAPDPVMNGKKIPKELRSVVPTGMIFFDADGNETGGLAMARTKKNDKMNVMGFDYVNSEAIGFNKYESAKGDFSAHFVIMDRLDLDKDPIAHGTAGATRFRMGTSNKSASFVLSDTQGKPRIKFSVDKNDVATMQMLDAEGKVVWSAPQSATQIAPAS